ncbi:MAG TPA: iron chelate uptake ABC transporter family permease subunit, partial [Candidatus Erysipelatoclostridium merdavium]|nr:iron chelate uptake ABC transporter family permease subunit [Candidatus Erysipelatoclostridium merdavium]
CIGVSTVIFQSITNNKILTPSIIGLDSLYLCFLLVLVLVVFLMLLFIDYH